MSASAAGILVSRPTGVRKVVSMPITDELREEIAGVVAVVDVEELEDTGVEDSGAEDPDAGSPGAATTAGRRFALWHVAVAPADPGPRLRGAWVLDSAAELEPFVRHRPTWALSAAAADAVRDHASMLVDGAATDDAIAASVAALDAAFTAEVERTGATWVRPDWSVTARLAADDPDSATTDVIDDELVARVLVHARSLENVARQWAAAQSLRTARQGRAESRAFLRAEEFGGDEPAPLPVASA